MVKSDEPIWLGFSENVRKSSFRRPNPPAGGAGDPFGELVRSYSSPSFDNIG